MAFIVVLLKGLVKATMSPYEVMISLSNLLISHTNSCRHLTSCCCFLTGWMMLSHSLIERHLKRQSGMCLSFVEHYYLPQIHQFHTPLWLPFCWQCCCSQLCPVPLQKMSNHCAEQDKGKPGGYHQANDNTAGQGAAAATGDLGSTACQLPKQAYCYAQS